MSEKQRVNMDLDKELWKNVGIRCAELDMQKKDFVEQALEKLLKESKTNHNYYLEERTKVKNHESLNDVYFNGKTLENAGWSGGDIPEKNLYKQFYVDKREGFKGDVNHYAVWWDLSDFFESEENKSFEWNAPHSAYLVKDYPKSTVDYFSEFTPLNKEVEIQDRKMTIINRPVRHAPTGYDMIYWAGAIDENGEVYKLYWNIFNLIEPSKIEMTVDNNKYCKHCLQNWTLNETPCTNKEGHEFVDA